MAEIIIMENEHHNLFSLFWWNRIDIKRKENMAIHIIPLIFVLTSIYGFGVLTN